MIRVTETAVIQWGNDAGHIAALAEMMATALTADPENLIGGRGRGGP